MGDRRRDNGGTDELDGACARGGHAGSDTAFRGSKRVPGILIAVVGATAIVGALDLAARYDVAVLGPLPQGLPGFVIPWVTYADIVPVLLGGCAIALVSFADTTVLSRAYAARTGAQVDPNQEMVGLGAANLAAGFFKDFQSAAAAHAPPWPRPPAPAPN